MKRFQFYILITFVITLYLLAACKRSGSDAPLPPSVDPATIRAGLEAAEIGFRQRDDLGKLREAIGTLSAIRDPDNRNFDVETAFARDNYFLGIHTSDESESKDAFEKGRAAGKIASKIEPDKPDGHFWFGACLGEQAKRSPITVGLTSIDDVREAMNKVIELDPGFQGASAYDALAQVELGTRFNGGKAEKAVEYLQNAVEIEKHNSTLHVDLAQAYEDVHKNAEARKELEYVLTMTPDPNFLPEHRDAVATAKKRLQAGP